MGIENITMPQLGESVTEGTISSWFISPGTEVKKYDPIAEVITDKVTAEIPSSFTGVIKEIIAKEGETLAVGEIICTIETEETKTSVENSENIPQPQVEEILETSQKQRYSPAVLKLSQEHGIQLNEVNGTGKGGRITRKDILLFIENQSQIKIDNPNNQNTVVDSGGEIETFANQAKETTNDVVSTNIGDIEIPVTGIRKAIATNMVKAKQEIPHAWLMVEADVTNLVQYRDSIKEEFLKKEGFSLTYFSFFVKAVAQGLKEFPQMNSMWAGDKIVQKKDIHLSIAVSTDDALFVPVIKYADEKTIKGIAKEITELAQKARTGKLRPEDMTGGTFTVNNTGSFGSVQSMGIINYPQAAILQVESIVKKPVVMQNGMFAARDMVNLCLSLDHRILDGLICGRFLKRVKEILENISKENTNIY
jgi:2-oxoisovalerate dehydrogenase E2 component (dihydrolipoyl transacylase)